MRYDIIILIGIILAPYSFHCSTVSLWDNAPCAKDCSVAGMDDFFIPEDIVLENDALTGKLYHPETWYVEGFFNNNYSMVFIITLIQGLTQEVVLMGLYIYENGQLTYETRAFTHSSHVTYSTETPLVIIDGKEVMRGYVDDNGRISYNVSFEHEGIGIHLDFHNRTQGWQGKMGDGWWLAIPDLDASGTVTINGTITAVEGRGYHDHNIFHPRSPFHERGYSDGKFHGDTLSFVWGKIFHSQLDTDTLGIVSNKGKYMSIPQTTLLIVENSHIIDHGHRIPTEVSISFHGSAEDAIKGSLVMTATGFHHIRLPFLFYWRYHVLVNGTLTLNGIVYEIGEVGMMELMLY